MISGDRSLAVGKRGAFYNTMEEFHRYWDRIDIIVPKTTNYKLKTINYFDNVFIHSSPWPLIFQPWWILKKGRQIFREQSFDLITVHEYPPFYNGIGARIFKLLQSCTVCNIPDNNRNVKFIFYFFGLV